MSATSLGSQSCEHVLDLLDSYLDNELSVEVAAEISSHLSRCPACSGELEARRAMRNRLRGAVRGISAAPDLRAAIQGSIRSNRRPAQSLYSFRAALPIAAALIICATALIAYRLGYMRLTRGSQDSYIASISAPIAGVMRVGLGDHVHCAVYHAFSNRHPTFEEMEHDMGQYKHLTAIVAKQIPGDYRVVMAHQCRYHGRRFVHLTLENGSALVSLVISRRGEGESFKKDQLVPALTESGIAIYTTPAQHFQVSGFETRDHLVYVVSNLRQADNLKMMLALAPSVNSFLQSIKG